MGGIGIPFSISIFSVMVHPLQDGTGHAGVLQTCPAWMSASSPVNLVGTFLHATVRGPAREFAMIRVLTVAIFIRTYLKLPRSSGDCKDKMASGHMVIKTRIAHEKSRFPKKTALETTHV